MNTKKKTIKSILCCTTACSALTLAGVGAMNLNTSNYEVFATGVPNIAVEISNSNFNDDSKSSYPYSPSSYTAYNQGVKVESSSESNINAGVINLNNEKYSTKFSLAKRTSLDSHVLMIDSTTEKDGKVTMHDANYGFQTSSTYKLDANSKYMFTVDVFNVTDAEIANLYLFDNAGEIFSSIKNINSHNTWTTYTFFVATNNTASVDVRLGMYLEGAGTVLFDNISAFKLSDSEYEFSKQKSNAGTFVEEDKVNNIVKVYNINSLGQFVNTKDDSDTSNFTEVDYEFNKDSSLTTVKDSDGQNTNALLLQNNEKTYAQYETIENFLTFEQNTIYKVSVNVKTSNLEGKAYLKLIRTDIEEDDKNYKEDQNKTIEIGSNTVSSSNSVSNDYKTYSFLINSHSKQSVSYKLIFGLGDKSNATKGKMYVSEVELSKIDFNTYDKASTGSGTEKITFVDEYKNSKIMLDNGDFNAFKIADYLNPMPATPISWEVTLGEHNQKHGVVNTSAESFNKLDKTEYSNLVNPSVENNNVLMMYNETADTLSYTSTAKKLTEKTYHKFEARVQSQNAPLKVSLVTKKNDTEEVELASKIVNTFGTWQNVTMFLHTGYQAVDVSLKFTLETSDYGYAYIDDTTYNYTLIASQVEEQFKNAENSSLVSVTDLTKILQADSSDNFAKPNFFNQEKVSGVESGIITLNSGHLDEIIYDTNNLEQFNLIGGQVYGIRAIEDVFYTAKSNIGFKLTTGDVYYKITVDVYTQNLSTNENEIDEKLIGAGLKLSGFDSTFTKIKSNNTWTTYTFFVQPTSDTTTYLEFSLGNEDAKTKGDVFFGNITFSDTITAEEYKAAKESDIVNIVKAETKKNEDDEKTESESKNKISKTTWIYLIPSILTALAILIAVVGFVLRKIKFKKPTRKTKTAYDRNKTVSVQYYARKATALREQKIRELTADLEKINAQRKQYEEEYKQELTKLREMKIKRASATEIAKLEKDLKKNQKMSASLGVTANKISDTLSYTKTDIYLNSLIKQLSREKDSVEQKEQSSK